MNQFRLVAAGAIVLVILSAIFGRSPHPHFIWDYIPGFAALLGYGGCWLLVVGAKTLGKRWLERSEDYYDG
jgi:hypothetical protein